MREFYNQFFKKEESRTSSGIPQNSLVIKRKIREGMRQSSKKVVTTLQSSKKVVTILLVGITALGLVVLAQYKGKNI